jgi:hypothetical protein
MKKKKNRKKKDKKIAAKVKAREKAKELKAKLKEKAKKEKTKAKLKEKAIKEKTKAKLKEKDRKEKTKVKKTKGKGKNAETSARHETSKEQRGTPGTAISEAKTSGNFSLSVNATTAVSKIKSLGKIETINNYIAGDERVTVKEAASSRIASLSGK